MRQHKETRVSAKYAYPSCSVGGNTSLILLSKVLIYWVGLNFKYAKLTFWFIHDARKLRVCVLTLAGREGKAEFWAYSQRSIFLKENLKFNKKLYLLHESEMCSHWTVGSTLPKVWNATAFLRTITIFKCGSNAYFRSNFSGFQWMNELHLFSNLFQFNGLYWVPYVFL